MAWAELAGDWVDEPPRGDAVPDEDSFFLASLLPSRSFPPSRSCCARSQYACGIEGYVGSIDIRLVAGSLSSFSFNKRQWVKGSWTPDQHGGFE